MKYSDIQFVIIYKTFLIIREFSANETNYLQQNIETNYQTIQVMKLYWLIKVASQNKYFFLSHPFVTIFFLYVMDTLSMGKLFL